MSKTVTRILNKVIGIRDMGKNEVCWAGINGKNYSCSYKCKKINTHQLVHATRNPINSRKSIGNIYLIDARCLL